MMRAMLRVLVAGATGWTGAPLARAIAEAADLELAGGIARRGAEFGTVEEALRATRADVLVDHTSAAAVRGNVDAALAGGLHVVVGSSGLGAEDYAEIDAAARAAGRGVIAAGNFSVLAATLLHAASAAARHVSHWEVIDYGSSGKPDVPSGTSRELAERLGAAAPADHDADLIGPP
jgi:4-hydroxy-tetrahydrodipicolinate reductase